MVRFPALSFRMLRTVTIFAILIALVGAAIPGRTEEDVRKRIEIPSGYRWNLADIYATQAAWTADFNRIKKMLMPRVVTYKGKLNNAEQVLACFQAQEELCRAMDKVVVYAGLKGDENQADNSRQEMRGKAETLYAQVSAAMAFIRPELLVQPLSRLRSYMKEPQLAVWAHSFDALMSAKAHTLSKEGEELLASAGDMAGASNDINKKAREADLVYPKVLNEQGKEVQLSAGLYEQILENPDRAYRQRAFQGVFSAYDKVKNTLAATLNGQVKTDFFFAKARKYGSSLESALAVEHIPVQVYDNLVKTTDKNLKYLHQYVELRRKILHLDIIHTYDMYVPLVEQQVTSIPYDQAKQQVRAGLAPLGTNYLQVLDHGLNGGWVDVYETAHKATGGYSWGAYDTHPYVLLNYANTLNDMMTLAHEMGHAINAYYSNRAQQYANSGNPIFIAEVASTANELLLSKYLIAHAKNDQEKLFLLDNLVESIRGTVFTQVMYAEFEKAIHERVENGETLTADVLSSMWAVLLKKFNGPNYVLDDPTKLGWAKVPHFFMDFYVYKYATSMAAANELVGNITDGKDKQALSRYLDFLKVGTSDYPINVLKKAGVDATSSKSVDDIMAEFGKLVDQMSVLVDRIS